MNKNNIHFLRALNNISTHGDTDVFPYPLENTIFYDCKDKIVELLCRIDDNFQDRIYKQPPYNESQLVPVGYSGFRWCTQLDPLWNAYLLGLVIAIGDQIEEMRIPIQDQIIFSYRFVKGDEEKLFNPDLGWHAFHRRSLELADSFETVVICDVSDFYQRIRHHRLENALTQLSQPGDIPKKIIKLLSNFSGTYSHGLPVGGPAARLLSELVLNQTDQLLRSEGIKFCRFADDYHLFVASEEDAYDALLFLSKKLLTNEGLALQKAKTRIMSASEFKHTSPLAHSQKDEINTTSPQAFLSLSLRFDPYSPTAEDDYEVLKAAIAKFDIIGLLRKEIAKSSIDIAITRQIIKSLKFLPDSSRDQAVLSVCDSLNNLYPVFPAIILVIKDLWPNLSPPIRTRIGQHFRLLFTEKSRLIKTEINQSYAFRLLSLEYRQENIELFQRSYATAESSLIKRDIIVAMFNWRYTPWLSDLRSQYHGFSSPLRRAFIIGSFSLSDEGEHWRNHNKKGFSEFEMIIKDWAKSKADQHSDKNWMVPL
ncbi:RNA-directed DNA polymerase [Legionella sp. PATHC038]|uniref:RNA-directed DNA polymerase n=1 Tax=Legionella sheltonii TaxID=2992041 RepID=UPI0022448367|nr:RNA-directed DNA polymerase [Legionella sp. PATHC038]MCW8399819.1 RNA-directed DNA polymerase [Legionella sp. PATHC038]